MILEFAATLLGVADTIARAAQVGIDASVTKDWTGWLLLFELHREGQRLTKVYFVDGNSTLDHATAQARASFEGRYPEFPRLILIGFVAYSGGDAGRGQPAFAEIGP